MTTIPQQETIVQYVANVNQLIYSFAFYAPLPTDIQVYLQAPNANPVPSADILTLNVDYTVTYNVNPLTGGFITLTSPPTTGYYLTINRQVMASLTTNFANAQNFNGANLDAALDRLLLLCQQNQNYNLQRNLSYVINTYLPEAMPFTQLPPLSNQQIWQGTGAGVIAVTLEENPDVSTLRSELANNSPGTDGARLVGYYDAIDSTPTTVQAFLANIITFIQTQFAAQLFQSGDMKDYAGGAVQSGWLLCDGSAVSRTLYSSLFAAIGITWGAGDGSTTFNLPDSRRRNAVGSGGTAVSPEFTGTTTGSYGGEEIHTQQPTEVGSHGHTLGSNQNFLGSGGGNVGTSSGSDFKYYTVTNAINSPAPIAMNWMQLGYIVTRIIKI